MAVVALGQVNDLDLTVRVIPISDPIRTDYSLQQVLYFHAPYHFFCALIVEIITGSGL